MRSALTKHQQKIYNFLVEFIRENKFSPTIREIQSHFGYNSANSVVSQLKKLESKGYITKSSNKGMMKARTIRLVDDVIGDHTITTKQLREAVVNVTKRGYDVKIEEAIELLGALNIKIV